MKKICLASCVCAFAVFVLGAGGLLAQEVNPIEIPIEPPVANDVAPPIAEDVTEEDEFQEREANQPEPATPEPTTPEPATPEPATPEPAQPDPDSPEPATPEPATPEPNTRQPAPFDPQPQPTEPQPADPQPAPAEPEPVPPAQPQPPAGNRPDPAVEQLKSRLDLLESQIQALQDQPAAPANIEQRLDVIEQAARSLSQRLNAVEQHLRENGNSLAGGGTRSESAEAGGYSAVAPGENGQASNGASNGFAAPGGCPRRVRWVLAQDGCGRSYYVPRATDCPTADAAPAQAEPVPDPPSVEDAPRPEEVPTEPLLPEARTAPHAQPIARQQSALEDVVVNLPEPIDVAGMQRRDAGAFYTAGYNLFWSKQYSEAYRHLAAAAMLNPDDARYLYYRGLAELRLGHRDSAVDTIQAAAELEQNGSTSRSDVSHALERLQGRRRIWLETFRQEARLEVAGK